MGLVNQYPGIDEYAVQMIRVKARQLVGKAGFTDADRDDIEQELVIDLLARLPQFDPARAKRETFISRIVNHKVADLLKSRSAAMRDCGRCPESLQEEIVAENGCSVEKAQTLDSEIQSYRTGHAVMRDESERRELRLVSGRTFSCSAMRTLTYSEAGGRLRGG